MECSVVPLYFSVCEENICKNNSDFSLSKKMPNVISLVFVYTPIA